MPPGVSAVPPPAKECSKGFGSKARCGGAGGGAAPRAKRELETSNASRAGGGG